MLEPKVGGMNWLDRLLGRIGHKYWIRRIDRVLGAAKEAGYLNSRMLHELDHRLKYEPGRPWGNPDARRPARGS